jgi:peptide/nickel transport system substrate-binding protein/oligopeptide transport system substrate-binding protein
MGWVDRGAVLLLVVGLVVAAGAPVVGDGAPAAPRSGGTLRMALSADPPTLDPALTTDLTSAAVVRQVFDTLVELDEQLTPGPAIARRWTVSADRRVYTFELRRDVRFHHGRLLEAADVKYAWERAARGKRPWVFEKIDGAREFIEGRAREISGLRVRDAGTVEVRLAAPFAPFLYLVAYDAAAVVPREEVERLGEAFATNPVGTGAFRLRSWRRDDELVLERFPAHFRGPARLDALAFRILPEDLTRLNEYRAGQLDVTGVPASYCRVVEADPRLRGDLVTWPTLGTQGLRFNVEQAPWTDARARRAVGHAIDASLAVKTVQYGCGVPARGILPPAIPGVPEAEARLPYDPARARRLLAEAGVAGGRTRPRLTYHYNSGVPNHRLAELLQALLREVGIDLELRRLDWAAYLTLVDEGRTGFYRAAWVADYPDPENFLTVLFHSRNVGPAGNTSRYRNPAVDRLLDEADTMAPGPERDRRYAAAERQIVDDAVFVPLYHITSRALIGRHVRELEHSPLSSAPEFLSPFRKVWLAR